MPRFHDIPTAALAAFKAEAEKRYPDEACGFFLAPATNDAPVTAFVPARNRQDELHRSDPVRYPRTAREAYAIDPVEQAKVEADTRARGLKIAAVAHSHPEHGAYFSAEDRLDAAPWGEPLFPGLTYVVAAVFGGRVTEVREYAWDAKAGDFAGRRIGVEGEFNSCSAIRPPAIGP